MMINSGCRYFKKIMVVVVLHGPLRGMGDAEEFRGNPTVW